MEVARMMESAKPYFAMVCLQFGYAGMNILAKVSLNRGMSHYVLVAYRNAFATAALAPFALLYERKVRPKMTFPIFMQIFVLALLGPVIDQNLYYGGLRFTSPTFSSGITNIVLPAMTFLMALLCRMEKLEMRKGRCQAKVVGTLVTVGGAMVMTFYKGHHLMNFFWPHSSPSPPPAATATAEDWLQGSIFLIIAALSWASFFILQAMTLRRYSAHLSLSAMVCFMGTLQSIAVTFVMERDSSAWNIGFDMNLLTAVYAGIVSSSIAYYVQGVVMRQKGPVFVTAFNPLVVIIVSVIASFILANKIYLGGVLGGVLIMVGLCAALWSKHREDKETQEELLETVKCRTHEIPGLSHVLPRIDENEEYDVEMQTAGKVKTVAAAAPVVILCNHDLRISTAAAKEASQG